MGQNKEGPKPLSISRLKIVKKPNILETLERIHDLEKIEKLEEELIKLNLKLSELQKRNEILTRENHLLKEALDFLKKELQG